MQLVAVMGRLVGPVTNMRHTVQQTQLLFLLFYDRHVAGTDLRCLLGKAPITTGCVTNIFSL